MYAGTLIRLAKSAESVCQTQRHAANRNTRRLSVSTLTKEIHGSSVNVVESHGSIFFPAAKTLPQSLMLKHSSI